LARDFSLCRIHTGMRREMVPELGCSFGKLAGGAADQSKLAPSVAGMRATVAGGRILALARGINGAFFAVHQTGGDDAKFVPGGVKLR
jgi:hypothetical protein